MRALLTLLLTLHAAAQPSGLLQSKEPDYGSDANQPMVSLPYVVEFETFPDGTVYSLTSEDGGIEDRVVQALAQYRFTPSKTGMRWFLTVPVKRTIDSYEAAAHGYDPPAAVALEAAMKLDQSKLEKFERDLPKKDSALKRSALLVFAATHSGDDVKKLRVRQLDWLIQNEPKAEVLRTSVALIPKAEDPVGYETIRRLWIARVKLNPLDKDTVHGASNFLRLSDPEDVTAMLLPYSGRILHAMEWLGELYGLHAVGATVVDGISGMIIDAEPKLSATGLSAKIRTALATNKDLPVLLSAFAVMNEAARTLNTAGRFPDGYEEFCSILLTKIKSLKPNYSGGCQARAPGFMQITGDVMKGKLLKMARPTYPERAKQMGITGTVLLSAVIDVKGKIGDVRLIKGPLALYASSRDAVARWEYKPYLIGGQPVEVQTEIEVIYTLR